MPRISSMPMAYSRSSPTPDTLPKEVGRAAHILGGVTPRTRRLIVSGVLGGLVLIVIVGALLNWSG